MKRSFLVAAAFAFVGASLAHAAIIPLGSSGWQAVWDPSLDPFVNITVDPTTETDTVYIHKIATFTQGPDRFGLFPSIPIQFQQIASSSIVRIVILDETLTNATGANWTDFHWDLLDHGDAAFDPGSPFATSPLNNQTWYNNNMSLSVDGGVVAAGAVWSPGLSGGQLVINVVSKAQQPYTTFTLKETPTPEPASLLLIVMGAVALRRRWQ